MSEIDQEIDYLRHENDKLREQRDHALARAEEAEKQAKVSQHSLDYAVENDWAREQQLKEALERAEKAEARLRRFKEVSEGFPDPHKLRMLAKWLGKIDCERGRVGNDEVQRDLRRWADNITRAREALEK